MVMELTVVDAFTDRPFSGNPAAVAIVAEFPDSARMQAIAAEMALAETAFAVRRGADRYDLRWFTPTVEVDLCGHATLATTHIIGRAVRFETRSGPLPTTIAPGGLIELDCRGDIPERAELPLTLGLEGVRWFGRGRFDFLAELPSAASVRSLVPDLSAIRSLDGRGLIVTAIGDRPGVACVSRYFAPGVGIAEDPVTGSAHCTLGSFWAPRLGIRSLTGEQASPRGGTVHTRMAGDRVVIGGQAVTVSTVSLLV